MPRVWQRLATLSRQAMPLESMKVIASKLSRNASSPPVARQRAVAGGEVVDRRCVELASAEDLSRVFQVYSLDRKPRCWPGVRSGIVGSGSGQRARTEDTHGRLGVAAGQASVGLAAEPVLIRAGQWLRSAGW
jgi:hypothetical protein